MSGNEKNQGRAGYLLKNTGLLTISSFSSKILVFLLVPLYTSVLSEEEYGVFDLVQTTVLLLLPILTINIYDAVMRYCMDSNYDHRIITGIGTKFVGLSILVFTALSVINLVFQLVPRISQYTGYMVLYYSAYLCNQFLVQYAKGKEKVKIIAIAGVVNTIVCVALNILLLLHIKMGVAGLFIAYIAGLFSSSLVIIFGTHFFSNLSFAHNQSYQKEMIMYSAPLVLGTIGWWCNNASDRYVITYLCGFAANGIYSVAYKIPSILTTVQQIFTQAWQVSAVKSFDEEGSCQFYGRVFKTTNIIMCLICMGLILFTKSIAHILYKNGFYDAWQYVPFLLVASVFNSASGVVGPVLNANKDSKSLGISSLIGTISNVILNVVFVLLIGPQGAAIATVIASFIIFILRKKALNGQIAFTSYSKDCISWVILVLQAICMVYVPWIYIQFVFITIFVVINKHDILKLFDDIKGMVLSRR